MPEQPPYLRVADELRRRIAEHVWEPGVRLPSRAQIGQECGVGENVVRRAQELLISQGVLEGRAGSGTYVAEPRQRVRMVRSSAREQPDGSPFRADMKGVDPDPVAGPQDLVLPLHAAVVGRRRGARRGEQRGQDTGRGEGGPPPGRSVLVETHGPTVRARGGCSAPPPARPRRAARGVYPRAAYRIRGRPYPQL
ncbi:hypothetical protein Srut_22560 [Streptomyces rutgersensis]|nr:hypothetical protein Srut_22560 [Streptomyces rutgersensis]